MRRFAIAALQLHYHQEEPLVFDIFVGQSLRSQHLDAPLLEVDEVLGMVQKPHAIGLGVTNADVDASKHHGEDVSSGSELTVRSPHL